jgi:signal peptidase I
VRISRELIHSIVGLAVLGILVHTWLLQGLVVPVVVTSGSMAPHLLGPHRQWVCLTCGHTLECDRESLSDAVGLNCPHCGTACEISNGVDRPGDRVLVDRSAFLWRSPRRWEPVVFRSPEDPGALCVKRVAGLPGESVQLRGGDVFVNGAIARKSIADQRDTAIGVYELPEIASDEVIKRWRAEPAGSWQFVAGRFIHREIHDEGDATSQFASASPIDWLGYCHRQCFRANEGPRPGPILDESPYDASESRVLRPVDDVILRCRITASLSGTFYLRAIAGGDAFTIEVDPARSQASLMHNRQAVGTREFVMGATAGLSSSANRATLAHCWTSQQWHPEQWPFREGVSGCPRQPVRAVTLPSGALAQRAFWELVLADHQLLLAIDGRTVIEFRYQPIGGGLENQAPQVAVGARGAEVELQDLEVLRDIYYTAGPGKNGETGGKYQLGPDEYFLLGDNSPHSLDSRVWSPQDGISSGSIVGRALKW